MNRSLSLPSLVLSTAILTPLSGHAVIVNSAGVYALPGTTVAAEPQLAGTVLQDMITNYSFTGAGETVEGQIQHRVVRSVDGTIDFAWRIKPTGGTGDISAFRLSGFAGYNLNANWRIDGLGSAAPDSARSFGNGSINFLFNDNEVGRNPDGSLDTSYFFFLDTDAIHYDMSGTFDQLCAGSGCVSPLGNTFAPSEVPVPAAAWLFGSALVGLWGAKRKR